MTDMIANLPPVSEMMRDCGLEPKKQFGQNFLFDKNLLRAIASDGLVEKNDIVLEIGAGAGTLTSVLSENAKKVVCMFCHIPPTFPEIFKWAARIALTAHCSYYSSVWAGIGIMRKSLPKMC